MPNGRVILNGKEAAVTYFKMVSQYETEVTDHNQDNRSPGRY